MKLSEVVQSAPLKLSDVQSAPQPSTTGPLDGMSTADKFIAAIGQGMHSTAQGAEQLVAHYPWLVGPEAVVQSAFDPGWKDRIDTDVADSARMDRPLLNTSPGQWGSLAGSAALTAPIGGIGGGGAQSANWLGRAIQAIKAGAIGGAGAGAVTPVENANDFGTEKLKQIGEGSALGAVVGGGLKQAGEITGALANAAKLPFRMAAGKPVVEAAQEGAAPSPAKDFMTESDRLSQETGVPFTPGQSTGSKGLTTMEQKLRQSKDTADTVFAHDDQAAQALDDYINRMLNNTSKNARSPEETGDLVRTAIKNKIADIEGQRKTLADQQYGAIRQQIGGRPLIEPDNLRAALSDIATENGNIATPGAEALTRFANKTSDSGLGDVNSLMSLRSYLSKVAGGQAKISGEGVDRKVARDLLGAIDNDLDANAEKLGGPVGDMLRTANQNYRNFSGQIDYLKKSPLGKLLGEDVTGTMTGDDFNTIPPEKIVARVKAMTPSEVSVTKTMMQDASPEAWQAVKRRVIEDALEQSRNAAPSQGANTLAMQPTTFVRALQGNTPKGQAWAQSLLEPNELAQLRNAYDAALRLGDKTGYNFSGTGANLEGDVRRAATAAAAHSVTGLAALGASKLAGIMTNKQLAAAMVDPEGRNILLQLRTLGSGSNRSKQLAAQLAAITAEKEKNAPNAGGDTTENP